MWPKHLTEIRPLLMHPFVGAGLLAKALFESMDMRWMYRPHRQQAGSYRGRCWGLN
jgi:hypothetical protein